RTAGGHVFYRVVLRTTDAQNHAGFVCPLAGLPGRWLVHHEPLCVRSIGPGPDGGDWLRIQYSVLAHDQLFYARAGKSIAPYLEPGDRRAVLHLLAAGLDAYLALREKS